MTEQRRFPCSDHEMWKNDLDALPQVTADAWAGLCTSTAPSLRQQSKSYAFAVEAYTLPSSVSTNICDLRFDIVYARATCFRSQKKTGRPYKVFLAFKVGSGAVADASCECPAGTSGACSHILAALRLIILLKQQGFKEAPPELTCTELPQQWRRPRRQGIRPLGVQDVDWRSPRENGVPMFTPMRFDARANESEEQDQLDSLYTLGTSLQSLGTEDFASVVLAGRGPFTQTRLGPALPGSPLSYQQAKLPSGFKTWLSASIPAGAGTVACVPELVLFSESSAHVFSGTFTADEWSILMELRLSPERARELELNSRQQAHSACWQDARLNRLTASRFGQVLKRNEWTQTGLRNLVEPKDLSYVRAVQYGLRNERQAADRYTAVMNTYGHRVSLRQSGLAVNPMFPWLGATPDRFVHDPEELGYGVLEIKCPYSLRNTEPDHARAQQLCMTFSENNEPQLNRDHDYYAQVLGQMALTGCSWADFVLCSEKWIAVERIQFDKKEWEEMRSKLDRFFFVNMLPYLSNKQRAS